MNRLKLLFISFLVLSFGLAHTQSTHADQVNNSKKGELAAQDTLPQLQCSKYYFEKGDTLIYNAIAYDSIIVNFEPALLKSRFEQYIITCDSVTKDGKFLLSQTLRKFKAVEAFKDNSTERTKSPWVGRTVSFFIDSVGKKSNFSYADTINPSISPGGAFTPFIISNIDQTCMPENETWFHKETIPYVENAFPPAAVRQTRLFKSKKDKDTLGYDCYRLEAIVTAQGNFKLEMESIFYQTTCVINGFNDFFFSKELNVPVQINAKIEVKMTIRTNIESEIPGQQFIDTKFTLAKLVRNGKTYLVKTK